MRKSSRRNILYDLITNAPEPRRKSRLSVPAWWSQDSGETGDAETASVADAVHDASPSGTFDMSARSTSDVNSSAADAPPPMPSSPPAPSPAARFADSAQAHDVAQDRESPDAGMVFDSFGSSPPVEESPPNAAVTVHEGRLVVILNPVAGIVAASVLCIVSFGLFALGRNTASPSPVTMTSRTDGGQVRDSDLGGGPGDSNRMAASGGVNQDRAGGRTARREGGPEKPPGERDERTPSAVADGVADNLHHLWIQGFTFKNASTKAQYERDATAIQDFLRDQGIPTVIESISNDCFIVFSKECFAKTDANELEMKAFAERVEQLGQLYKRQGGGYDFKGCLYSKVK